MSTNIHNVPELHWVRWSDEAQVAFNEAYAVMEQRSMCHPKMPKLKPGHWKTIRWNAAWLAAELVNDPYASIEIEEMSV